MCLLSSRIKETQNLRISLSDLPLGSKSAPPLPPPMFTRKVVDQPRLQPVQHAMCTHSQLVHSWISAQTPKTSGSTNSLLDGTEDHPCKVPMQNWIVHGILDWLELDSYRLPRRHGIGWHAQGWRRPGARCGIRGSSWTRRSSRGSRQALSAFCQWGSLSAGIGDASPL